ncbi:MAG: molybdopterin-dependent oxidoreductase [Desulfobacula sp.]|jgi:anaerobic selenocysteine-containing dehydrogenase|uniref:molybdopterin-containing oxidoreductase family protein n=1 Tax=Desulfobacula sp. TaxID=2593537 RepID=UPI001DE53E25|nr:molybdopterin-dependent oxidoreductase [Desulfobacula sp.]MBT3484270.1 molybdopterin-dependent oxidoreductase [Desulfobacula sp.]MBT3804256.1 molybdopterin-dependent oxidoreductase [Desulfobacula sp.]MBT4025620.1 molybdopterin-dependent oxidoreductase [Desulfobacula sp.]MBT4198196.1 molybdopterin-dependent oxidoreductase [Desulfobacula sp.]
MTKDFNRRDFFRLGAVGAAALAIGKGFESKALAGTVSFVEGGKDFSPKTSKERQMIASACWNCVTRDSMVGYVEDGRLVKLEGQPNSIRGRGKICSKGAAGINQLYDPDRILYPMKRVGKRGEGKWKRISWDDALTDLSGRLKKLRDDGHPEKFMFHYGRMKGSSSKIVKSVFLANYGTKTVGNHTSICEGGKWTAQELTWGKHYDNWDFDNTKYVLNFGSNCLEAGTNSIPGMLRLSSAIVDRKVKLVTFDVRISNTAAKSTEWVPIKPGTDNAVVLAMCNVVLEAGLYDKDFFKYLKVTKDIDASFDEKISTLKKHLDQYTPAWAEKISGVPAAKIKEIALEFAKAKPACLISYRGAVAHAYGAETERSVQMLAAITGNIDNPGGRCLAVGAKWKYPKGPKEKPKAKALNVAKGFKGDIAYPSHGANHQVLKVIKDGKAGRPEIYMWYCYTPVYANGECQENIDILKDESLIPFSVCVNAYYDESAALADLILPNPSYLEWWDWEDMVSPDQIAEFYIRQPFVKPLGESRDFKDVVCELGERMGFPLGFSSAEEFVKLSCEKTPGVKEAGGFEYMKKHGVWHDPKAKPRFYSYKKAVKDGDLKKDGVILDESIGTYWNWHKSKAKTEAEAMEKGYTKTKNAYKGYVALKIGDEVFKGFKPDKLNKSGFFEIYSDLLELKGLSPLPHYYPNKEHENLKSNELILTTYKVAVHIHSRSTNCKWLTEIYHDNPAEINSATAKQLGIKTGDKIKVRSSIGEIITKANVTEGLVPGAIAISHHLGHWEYGRYASGKKAPLAGDNDPDLKLKTWDTYGVHPNWIIPNKPDPISGQQAWMDTVVTVTKA